MAQFDASAVLELHRRLLEGDPTASAEIATVLLPLIVKHLQIKFAEINDIHLIDEAVHVALLDYFRRPELYDPTKSNLLTFLQMVAYRDLLNLLKSEKRHGDPLPIEADVADDDIDREYTVDVADDFELEREVISRMMTNERLHSWLPDETDLRVVQMMMENVRETEAYASLLGITHLQLSEQEKIVKATKDRLKKLLKRRWRAIEVNKND